MDKKKHIKENWGKESLAEMTDSLNCSLKEILEVAFELQLHKLDTPDTGRRWTEEETEFLTNHAQYLSVREASNLLYRSHSATYQKVRVLGLWDLMINKK